MDFLDQIPNFLYLCCAGGLVFILFFYTMMREAWKEFEDWRKKNKL